MVNEQACSKFVTHLCKLLLLLCQAHHTSDDDVAGDVDVFILTEDHRNLTVNPVWLEHLQVSSSSALS